MSQPERFAGAVIAKDNKYLLVQESRGEVAGLWNLPAGHVESDETFEQAAVRETLEESGYEVTVDRRLMSLVVNGSGHSFQVFQGKVTGGAAAPSAETLDVRWFSLREIEAMEGQLRSGEVLAAIRAYCADDCFLQADKYMYQHVLRPTTAAHLSQTAFWVRQLDHGADAAMLTAAILHDIERSLGMVPISSNMVDSVYLRQHQDASAQVAGDFLAKINADLGFIERVRHLIRKHEVGGDADQDTLRDADSISFFENNGSAFLKKHLGNPTVIQKMDWMFDRIESTKAREIAEPMYRRIMELQRDN